MAELSSVTTTGLEPRPHTMDTEGISAVVVWSSQLKAMEDLGELEEMEESRMV